ASSTPASAGRTSATAATPLHIYRKRTSRHVKGKVPREWRAVKTQLERADAACDGHRLHLVNAGDRADGQQLGAITEREGGGAGGLGSAGQDADIVGAEKRGGVDGGDGEIGDGQRAGRRLGDGVAADEGEGVPGGGVRDRRTDVDVAGAAAADLEHAGGDI